MHSSYVLIALTHRYDSTEYKENSLEEQSFEEQV